MFRNHDHWLILCFQKLWSQLQNSWSLPADAHQPWSLRLIRGWQENEQEHASSVAGQQYRVNMPKYINCVQIYAFTLLPGLQIDSFNYSYIFFALDGLNFVVFLYFKNKYKYTFVCSLCANEIP